MLRSLLLLLLTLGFQLAAPSVASAELRFSEPWARLQPPSAEMSAAFLVIENAGTEPDALVGASCACAKAVELHVMQEVDGRMSMRQVERFAIPAGGRFALAPGGPHLMLIGLTAPLSTERPLEIRLRFERGGEQTLVVPVRDPRASAPQP